MSEADSLAYPWPTRKLEGLTTKIGSGATPRGGKDVYASQGTAFIRSQNVFDNRMDITEIARISDEAAYALRGVEVSDGDVLLNITGDSVARCCLADSAILPARVSQHVAIIRPTGELNPGFLQKFMVTPGFKDFMMSICSGGTRNALTKAQIGGFRIPVPPRPVQDAIAAILGAFDDKIAVNDRIADTTLALGDTFFAEMVRTSTADCSALGELAAEKAIIFGDGYRTKRSEHGLPGVPILRVAEVRDGRIEPEFIDFVAEAHRSAMGSKVSQPGDVILTTKGTVGRVAVIAENDPSFVYSPQLCYFRTTADSPMANSFVYFWLRSSDFWRQAESRKSQTDMADYLSLADIKKLTIPLLDPISGPRWSAMLSGLLGRLSACHAESQALAELRDYLLPKLMSGEIRVRDAEKVVEDVT